MNWIKSKIRKVEAVGDSIMLESKGREDSTHPTASLTDLAKDNVLNSKHPSKTTNATLLAEVGILARILSSRYNQMSKKSINYSTNLPRIIKIG